MSESRERESESVSESVESFLVELCMSLLLVLLVHRQ